MMKNTPMRSSRTAAAPTPAPTPAAKWLVGLGKVEGEAEGEAEGELVGEIVGEGEVEDTKELEVVVVASVDAEKLEVITVALAEDFGSCVEEVIAANEKIRDDVWQQSESEKL